MDAGLLGGSPTGGFYSVPEDLGRAARGRISCRHRAIGDSSAACIGSMPGTGDRTSESTAALTPASAQRGRIRRRPLDGRRVSLHAAVVHLDTTVIHSAYVDDTIINTTTVNRLSFDGGTGDLAARPDACRANCGCRKRHTPPTASQTQHVHEALRDPQLSAKATAGIRPLPPPPGLPRSVDPVRRYGGAPPLKAVTPSQCADAPNPARASAERRADRDGRANVPTRRHGRQRMRGAPAKAAPKRRREAAPEPEPDREERKAVRS